mgnify:CR=1 FL=1
MAELDTETLSQIAHNVEFAIRELGALVDFPFGLNKESVAWVEGFVERQRESGNAEPGGGLHSVIGSYLGEAIIAATGGCWDESEHGIGVLFSNGSKCFPFAKVGKQFENGAEGGDSMLSFYNVAVDQVATGKLLDASKEQSE